MKKLLIGLALMGASSVSYAVNPRILAVSNTYFPGEGINYYSAAETELVNAAQNFCAEFHESVDKISNVNIQIQTDFSVNASKKTVAETHPQIVYTGLVGCQ